MNEKKHNPISFSFKKQQPVTKLILSKLFYWRPYKLCSTKLLKEENVIN